MSDGMVTSTAMQMPWHERRKAYARLWRRFSANRPAIVAVVILLALIIVALFAPWIAPHDPTRQNLAMMEMPPGWNAWLGTDQLGRDVLSRLIYGARIALLVGFCSVGFALVLGTTIGVISGYFTGWIDNVLMRIMDVFLAFPYLLLAISIVAALGPGTLNTIIAIAVWLTPTYARLNRGVVLAVRRSTYVEAARAIGVSHAGIMLRHIVPNTLTPVLVQTTLDFARAIMMAAGLSFLGYGVQPPTPSWGGMIAEGRNELLISPHIVMVPGLAIVLTVLCLNIVGDAAREALDPRAS
jgi:ABC-type dipeptide/oligopeptide/nickel transport system permease subunit